MLHILFDYALLTYHKNVSGPLRSRAAKAIGFIDMMIDYSSENAPLQKELSAGQCQFLSGTLMCFFNILET